MDVKKLGEYLRDKRVNANLSQADVSSELGYSSAQFVSNWERGLSSPPLQRLQKILDLFRVEREEFIKFMLDMHEESLRKLLKKKGSSRR